MWMHLKKWMALAASVAFAACAASAQAEGFPTRPLKTIVPQTPGGTCDALARIVAQKLNERWGQPVGVDSRCREWNWFV